MNFQSIIDRLSEAFSVFDFSYFISGSATCVILSVFAWYNGYCVDIPMPLWVEIITVLLFFYISGIVSMVLGKLVRRLMLWGEKKCFHVQDFDGLYTEAVETASTLYAFEQKDKLLEGNKKLHYTMMWSALRNKESCSHTVSFINKYWVTQALCEGLMTSSLLAIAAAWLTRCNGDRLHFSTCIGITLIALVSFFLLSYNARRNAETQIQEVVIAYVLMKKE